MPLKVLMLQHELHLRLEHAAVVAVLAEAQHA